MLYHDSASTLRLRPVAYTTFCKVWRNFLADVVVCKPMTDVCATCQNNSVAIIRSINLSEEEKSEVSACSNMYMYINSLQVSLYTHVGSLGFRFHDGITEIGIQKR